MIGSDLIRRMITAGKTDQLLRRLSKIPPLDLFVPRPDKAMLMDMQSSFVNSTSKFAICLGGTGSGKTEAAAVRTARYLRDTPPPRERCPFWIIGETFELVCSICWEEKLSRYIDPADILSIDWYKPQRNWPHAVILRHPKHRSRAGWVIEFKSYTQGRELMQGRSIGGYWFNEECPTSIVTEVQGRCRDYDSPGWADFTPLSSYVSGWEKLYNKTPPDWKFYHLNTELNKELKEGWSDHYLKYSVTDDERETRRVGTFASYRGMVFKEFRHAIHVLPDEHPIVTKGPPKDWFHIRGVDFGWTNPLACMWVAVDRDQRYYVYDEHYKAQKLLGYHAAEINSREWLPATPYFGQTYCDDEDPGSIAELMKLGVANCTGTNKNTFGVSKRIAFLRQLMIVQPDGKPRLYISPRCENLIEEIRGYHWSVTIGKDARERNAPDMPVDFQNHAIDAMGYAIFTHAMGDQKVPKSVRREWEPRDRKIQLSRNPEERR